MKKMSLLLGSLLLSVACMFSGCTEKVESDPAYNLAVVASAVNNNPKFDAKKIDETKNLMNAPDSSYSFILSDSTPSVVYEGTIPNFEEEKDIDGEALKRVRTSAQNSLIKKLNSVAPDSPECDILSSVEIAVRQIRAHEVEGRDNVLVVCGSGISTEGLVDMKKNPVCELDGEVSVKNLKKVTNLDMTGIKVVFYYCGDTTDPQPSLSSNERATLKEFYEKLFKSMNATSVTFKDDMPVDGEYKFDQMVSTMKTETTKSALTSKENVKKEFENNGMLSFTEKDIQFKSNSTEIEDKSSAKKTLSYVVQYMKENKDFDLMVFGTTTSDGTKDGCIKFSEGRANSIRDILIDEGIEKNRVYTCGCGYSSSLYINDRDAEGKLDEKIAPKNRTVKLVNYNSQTAKEIIASI